MSGDGPESPGGTGPGRTGRRVLAYAVMFCLAGAGLAVFAATRTWTVELIPRAAPLPGVERARTGGDLLPWLPALALVGLAGAGALLASRGTGRRLLGGLLLLVGAGVVAGAVAGGSGPAAGEVRLAWPVLCLVGGVLIAGSGALAVWRGAGWPAMGARYERAGHRDATGGADPGGPALLAGAGQFDGRRTVAAWDALDRGEDPTVS